MADVRMNQAAMPPGFLSGEAGVYRLHFKLENVPLSAPTKQNYNPAVWTSVLAQKGFPGIRVLAVQPGKTAPGRLPFSDNPHSTGGYLDAFGWGQSVADFYYFVDVEVEPGGPGLGFVGLGAVQFTPLLLVAAIVAGFIVLGIYATGVLVLGGERLQKAVVRASDAVRQATDNLLDPLLTAPSKLGVNLALGLGALALVFFLAKKGGVLPKTRWTGG